MDIEGSAGIDIKEQLSQASISSLHIYPIKSCAGSSLDQIEVVPTGFKHDRELMLMSPTGRFISQRDKGGERLASIHPQFVENDLLKVEAPNMPELFVPIMREGKTQIASVHQKNDIQVVDQGSDPQKWFQEYLGFDCQLVAMAEGYERQVSQRWAPRETDQVGFADGYPFLLTSQESLDDLNKRLEEPVPMNRFRPNIVMQGSGIPYGEDMVQRLTIGKVLFDVVKPCIRCVITTRDQERGQRVRGLMGKEPLATLYRYRNLELKTGDKGPIFGQNLVHENTGVISVGDNIQVLTTGEPPVFSN